MPTIECPGDGFSRQGTPRSAVALSLVVLAAVSCSSPEEATQVNVPVVVDHTQVEPVTTDLDYEVEVSEAKIMAKDFTFALAGEIHSSTLLHRAYDWLVPTARAHPGHYQGGDITGEMPGRFLLDFLPGEETNLGQASLLVGSYHSANFVFTVASDEDVKEDDPLLGHSALLRGIATKDGKVVSFLALIDSPEDRQLTGIPFEYELEETSDVVLQIRLETVDELEGDTLFDGLDFLELDDDSDGEVEIVPGAESDGLLDAYNLLRRTLQTHDHFEIVAVPSK